MGKPNNLATTKMIKEARQLTEKSLYNHGVFDTYTHNGDGTGTVKRQTGLDYFDGSENWSFNSDFNGRFYRKLSQNTGILTNTTSQYVKINQSALKFNGAASSNSLYVVGDTVYIRRDEANGDISAFKKWLSQNPLLIQYKTTDSYEENVIDGQTIHTLPQEGEAWLNSEWRKGLNLIELKPTTYVSGGVTFVANSDGSVVANGTSTAGNSSSSMFHIFRNIERVRGKTITLSGKTDKIAVEGYYRDGNNVDHYFNGSSAVDGKQPIYIPLDAVAIDVYCAVRSANTVNNAVVYPMLNLGTHPYPHEHYHGEIVRQNEVPIFYSTDSASPAQTIGGTWENLGSFQIGGNTVYAWKRQN